MESFSKTHFNGVKKTLLKGNNYKSINQVRREYPNLSDNEIYQNLLETILRKASQQRKRKDKKSILPFRNSEIESLGQITKRVKPSTDANIRKFKNSAFEIKYQNNDPNSIGFKSLSLINNAINILRNKLNNIQ